MCVFYAPLTQTRGARKHFAMSTSADFSMHTVLSGLELLNNQATFKNFPSTPFLDVVKELAKLTSLLGPALYFAARDVDSKIKNIEAHLQNIAETTGQRPHDTLGYPLRLLVLNEAQNGTADNPEHPSVSRTFMRLIWFLDFTLHFAVSISDVGSVEPLEDDGAGGGGGGEPALHTCAREAYEKCLAPFHKPLVCVAVRLGLYACPSRNTFYAKLNPNSTLHDGNDPNPVRAVAAANVQLRQLGERLQTPVKLLWEFARERGLQTIR